MSTSTYHQGKTQPSNLTYPFPHHSGAGGAPPATPPAPPGRFHRLRCVGSVVITALLSGLFTACLPEERPDDVVVETSPPENSASQGDSTSDEPSTSTEPAEIEDPTLECASNLTEQAGAVLTSYCYRCHGQKNPATAGLNVHDTEAMIADGIIVVGAPEKSPLYQRAALGEMPPTGEEPRPSPPEVELIRQWIACGASYKEPDEPHTPVGIDEVFDLMRADLETLSPVRRARTRYFVLSHLYNANQSNTALERYRQALSKLTNSLSWQAHVTVPTPVDSPRNTVFRIELDDYQWQAIAGIAGSDLWEKLLKNYPFGTLYENHPDAQFLAEETNTTLPWIHADWFIDAASLPPLYYDMLRLPNTATAVEKLVGAGVKSNIQNRLVARAGFNNSGVALHNRVLERHPSLFGSYWLSYDFSSSVGVRNVFENPVGPVLSVGAPSQFVHDGGEAIFTLPNGLHAFAIYTAGGARIDAAPTNIVSDPKQNDGAVRAGRSCMSCHIDGILLKDDLVRSHVVTHQASFNEEVFQAALDLYPIAEEMADLQLSDRDDYIAARAEAGADAGGVDPVFDRSEDFELSLNLDRAAAELWTDPKTLKAVIEQNPTLSVKLGPLVSKPNGLVERLVFETAFPELVCAIGDATPFVKAAKKPCQ
ncbi:MAG: hypothetical protein IPK82_18780 [Polyangiaceae bacterium]|nr:hypothetical protein [Polyangiaceae bacterium]